MSEPATSTSATPDDAPVVVRALIERQLQVLGRLAEAGLNIALAVESQAIAAAEEPEPARLASLVLAYGRASRATRLTVTLQARLIKDLQALDEVSVRHERAERRKREEARKARVERIVERVIQAASSDEAEIDRLAGEACERLEHDDFYGDLLDRPVSEIIALVCRDLGLAPDWGRLAEEAWAQDEIRSGVAAAPLAALGWAPAPERAAAADPFLVEPRAASP